jgi:hypothetical protein
LESPRDYNKSAINGEKDAMNPREATPRSHRITGKCCIDILKADSL